MSIQQKKLDLFESVTRDYLEGRVSHAARVSILKKAGFNGAELVDLNNDFMEKFEAEEAKIIFKS